MCSAPLAVRMALGHRAKRNCNSVALDVSSSVKEGQTRFDYEGLVGLAAEGSAKDVPTSLLTSSRRIPSHASTACASIPAP